MADSHAKTSKFGTVIVTEQNGDETSIPNAMILMGLNGNIAIKNSSGVTVVASNNITAWRE